MTTPFSGFRRTALFVAALGLVAAGCADDDEEAATTSTSTAATTTTATSTPTESNRPPLPTDPPTGPVTDRRVQQLPPDFEPVAWTDPPPRPVLEGPLAVNERLTAAEIVGEAELTGAEDVAQGLDGHLYTGTEDGTIWRLVVEAGTVARLERVTTLAGRPLGIDAYTTDVLVVASAEQGLVAVNTATGDSWVLADRLNGDFIFFPDGVTVAPDGTIYFTEASTRYIPGFPLDFLDGRPNGRVLRYEPSTGATDLVADGLYFANGIEVTDDETSLLVAESFRFRIVRIGLDGDRFGAAEPFGPPLINAPDNIRFDDQGRLWVGGSDLRSDLVDAVLTSVDLRRQLLTTPPADVAAARPPYGFSQVLGPDGAPVFSFHDPSGRFVAVSAALVADGYVTFATLRDQGVARIPIPAELT